MAKARGDYLIVGVYSDQSISSEKGVNYPVLNIYDRVLNLLSLSMVDDIVFDAPLRILPSFIQQNKIDEIVEGQMYYLDTLKND